jgi:hypothetical protein
MSAFFGGGRALRRRGLLLVDRTLPSYALIPASESTANVEIASLVLRPVRVRRGTAKPAWDWLDGVSAFVYKDREVLTLGERQKM